jgi:hypothetical protein
MWVKTRIRFQKFMFGKNTPLIVVGKLINYKSLEKGILEVKY